ncbi:GNAT family N-acetyltransferase [Litchfieldia salsa]|uniref:Protein N-acetyltransferase, RimJ/RimL family n=1 Tax=Litchfieldia salsa TaxID=930152 RepID=A0A1H0T286_9BACI|nr:GNAT family protein [Litchfieldia salsa]SDP48064.1 Protein N-acetyltransferase, RimJ/RimL family [Litchfieldia salsa]
MDISLNELTGDFVKIVPMQRKHIKELYEIGNSKSIWTHLPKIIETYDEMESFVAEALSKKEVGTELPFIVLHRESNKIVGSTRFLEISNTNKTLEIGWTWFTPSVWGTQTNIECKYLLLKHCFETLKMIRVQFKTDEKNIRSQKAIERIGGVKEGVLRNHMIRKDGTYRNSVFYSIIDSDWAKVKNELENAIYSQK